METLPADRKMAAQLALRDRPRDRRPVMNQRWDKLLFLHWQVDADEIAQQLPPGLSVDLHEGKAWLGVVPFFMRKIRPAGGPSLPWISNFLELNVRTYVVDENGTPGVWFFSLDTDRWLARTVARQFFKLPYFWAKMSASVDVDGWVHYRTLRREAMDGHSDDAEYRYRGVGDDRPAAEGSLEFFLLERYLLFAWNRTKGQLLSGRVWHTPYRYQDVELPRWSAAPVMWDGLTIPCSAPTHQCYVERVEVDAFAVTHLP